MKDKVKILTCCSHYDDIIKHDFLEDDILTRKLIEYYKNYILSIEEVEDNLSLIKKLDDAMFKYIGNYAYAKALKETLDIDLVTSEEFTYVNQLMLYVVEFYDKYDDNSTVINITKWI